MYGKAENQVQMGLFISNNNIDNDINQINICFNQGILFIMNTSRVKEGFGNRNPVKWFGDSSEFDYLKWLFGRENIKK